MSWLEEFWGDLLSEQPLRITAAWVTLDLESQNVVYAHLQKMANEDGWQDSQRQAAQAALLVLQNPADPQSGSA